MARIFSALVLLLGIVWLSQQPGARAQIGVLGCGAVNQHALMFQPCGTSGSGPFTPSCSQSTTFLARTGPVSFTNAQKTNYDNLICGLETDSVGCSTVQDAVYVLAAPDAPSSLLNLCGTSFSLVSHGTITFTANTGYIGNGSTGYLDTQLNMNGGGAFYSVNSATVVAYTTTTRTSNANTVLIGGDDSTDYTYIEPLNGGTFGADINGNAFAGTTNSAANGSWVNTRSAAALTAVYLNGSLTPFMSGVGVGGGPPGANLYISALNDNGTPARFSTDNISFAVIGSGLTAANAKKVSDRLNTFAKFTTGYGSPINVY